MKNLNLLTTANLIKFLTFALVFVFTSCEKKEEVQWPDNPYNYIGEQHNDLMTEFQTQHGEEFEQITNPLQAEEFIIGKMYKENAEQGYDEFNAAKEKLGLSRQDAISSYNFMNTSTLCDAYNFPAAVEAILCPTLAQLITLDGNDENAEIHKVIRDAEIRLMKDTQDEEGYVTAMTILAVAKYSADHNIQYKAAGNPKWWQVVLADAAGAGIGLIGGGTASVPLAAGFSAAVLKID